MDKNKCTSCGEVPKCSCKNKNFTKAVVEINNPDEVITLMRKVVVPASMGDDTAVPPALGKYKNVLLYYEANSKSYLYSSDGIPTLLANGVTDYEQAVNLPQINGVELIGNKTLNDLGINYYVFDTVADMKTSVDLIGGDYVRTYGYYTKNDLGGAFYKITSGVPSGYYETLSSGLYAELIIEDTMNVKQFGAKGDGSTDDTLAIQTAVDNCSNVYVPNGTYMVDADTHINLRTGSKFTLNNDATLKAITNNLNTYTILLVEDCTDVEISGGTIEGDRNTHTGSTGEWGHCIRLWGTSNHIYIHDINLINAWGDGIDCDITGSVVTARVHVNNARRNGYSITKADSFISNDDIIENTHGTNPQCGVDIEPNASTDVLRNIIFNGLRTKNNSAYGIYLALVGGNESDNYTSIEINNLRSDGDYRGIGGTIRHGRIGNIDIKNPVILNSTGNGILLFQRSLMPILIDHPVIRYYGASSTSSVGMDINGSLTEGAAAVGNIDIVNPIVTDPVLPSGSSITLTWAIYVHSPLTNVHIVDPIDLDGRLVRLGMSNGNLITDKFKLFKRDIDANYTISGDNMYLLTTSSNYTANHFVNIRGDQTYPIGTVFNFINTGDYRMEVKFPDNYVYPISSVTGTSVYLNNKGASMTVQRISSDAWTIVNQNGNITTS